MAYSIFVVFYLFVCKVGFIATIIYSCNRTADCGCSKENANVYKIVGGEPSHPSSWGWAVSLQWKSGGHLCTGSIISPLHIITAAHCVTDENLIEYTNVVVGIDRVSELDATTAQVRLINSVFIHPSYNTTTMVNDIAVLRLNEPLIISSEMATARLCLPLVQPSGREGDYPVNSATLVAIGWGNLESEAPSIPRNLHLQQVTLKAVPRDDETCAEFISDSRVQFCAGAKGGGKDTCQGDSGGPLMRFEPTQKRWVLAGVTSFGLGCGDPRYSGVYARASAYHDWLRTVINDGFIESLVDPYSAGTKNYYNIYFAVLSIILLYFNLL